MVLLKIFDLDGNDSEKPLSTFQIGEHVIGRGSFANCTDKKISRNHVIINVKENEATLTLIHVTPIFFMPSNNSNIQILRKDESKTLSDGDKFAFLTDTWYLVKLEYKEETPKAISGDVSTVLISNPSSKNTIAPSTSNTMVSQSTSIKRSAEDPYSRERKKLKLVSDSLDKLIDNIDQIVAQDAQVDDNNKTEQSNTTQVFKRETISDSDDEDSDELLPEVTRDTEIIEGIENNSESNSEAQNNLNENNADERNSEILDELNKEPMVHDDTPDVKIELQEVKEEATDNQENIETNEANLAVSNFDSHTNDNVEPSEIDQDNVTTQKIPTDASASSSGVRVNTVRREQCWYGRSCYRKNPSHKSQFSHPGDSDYNDNSDDNKPECPYGADCYRGNPQHRSTYKHPTSRPARKPTTSNRRRNVNTQNDMEYDSDSQEEGDPFSADESSSASEVFEGGDSDSDYMEEPSFDDVEDKEEVKIMFKEAKKFLRKKRKD